MASLSNQRCRQCELEISLTLASFNGHPGPVFCGLGRRSGRSLGVPCSVPGTLTPPIYDVQLVFIRPRFLFNEAVALAYEARAHPPPLGSVGLCTRATLPLSHSTNGFLRTPVAPPALGALCPPSSQGDCCRGIVVRRHPATEGPSPRKSGTHAAL